MRVALAARLDDLKRHTEIAVEESARKQADWGFMLSYGARRLARLQAAPEAISVISALPPEQTGLANFTLRTFREAGYPVDIFSRFTDAASYLALSCDESLAAAGVTFLPISLLPAARARRRYLAQVYEIGNSNHILPVLASLAAQATFPTDLLTFVHIHDPRLLDLLRAYLTAQGKDFIDVVSGQYGAGLAGLDDAALIGHGVLGARTLFSGIPGVHVLTNSQAARELIERDWPEARGRIHTLFHPVFPPGIATRARPRDTIRIGTFGSPSPAKCSETIVAAFRLLARESDKLELVIAGYDAGSFARGLALHDTPAIKVFDSPSDTALLELMQSCDLGVQLRRENLGESSGVVPQLMSLGVPVIVSRLGAFAEYGEAVATVLPDCSPETLAEAIRTELRQAGQRGAAQGRYAAAHAPEGFCKELHLLARGLSRRG